jgi:putative phage-type endonuclease
MSQDQGSSDWLALRKTKIGASDVAAILGISPWCTAYELWEIKTGRKDGHLENFAVMRGQRLEPKARAYFELKTGIQMSPAVRVSESEPLFMASYDGINEEIGAALEIKCPGLTNHTKIKAGVIPEYYKCQLEQQLLVTPQLKKVFFMSFYENEEGGDRDVQILEYVSNPELRRAIISDGKKFWDYVLKDQPPPLAKKDPMIVTDPDLVTLFQALKQADSTIQTAQLDYDGFRQEIIDRLPHTNVRCEGVTAIKNAKGVWTFKFERE